MPLSLRSSAVWLCLVAALMQTGCQMRGGDSGSVPYHPSRVVEHTVQAGETLSSIAARYGVSVSTLVDANRIRDRNLRPGSVIRVPGGKPPVDEAAPTVPVVVGTPEAPRIEALWYQPRSDWTRQPIILSRTKPMGGTPNRLTVHHSGDQEGVGGDSAAWLRQVDLNHIKGTNHAEPWACIGYHFIIDTAGKVYEGRPLQYQGAHAGNDAVNRLNIGVCLIGNFETARVPAAQRTALLNVLDRLCLQYGISRAKVYGHNKFRITDCPGRFLSQIIEAYTQRDDAADDDAPLQTALPTGATRLGVILPTRR